MPGRNAQMSTKRLMIDKANTTIVIAVAIAASVLAFSLVTARSLLVKRSYQSKVIKAQEEAKDKLKENIESVDVLAAAYSEFVNRPENIIGGNSQGDGDQDGDNAKIVLDALPGKYDFPALVASIEKILTDRNYTIQSITGVDQPPGVEVQSFDVAATSAQATTDSNNADTENHVEMPFELTAVGPYSSMVDLLKIFERSIRPVSVQNVQFEAGSSSGSSQVEMTIQARSYFKPEKTLDIKYEVVK